MQLQQWCLRQSSQDENLVKTEIYSEINGLVTISCLHFLIDFIFLVECAHIEIQKILSVVLHSDGFCLILRNPPVEFPHLSG